MKNAHEGHEGAQSIFFVFLRGISGRKYSLGGKQWTSEWSAEFAI